MTRAAGPEVERSLSWSSLVVVRFNGTSLARFGPATPWDPQEPNRIPLDADDLVALVEARRSGGVPPGPFADRLEDIGLLRVGRDDRTWPNVPIDAGASEAVDEGPWQLVLPLCLAVGSEGLEAYHHDGTICVRLAPLEVAAAESFIDPRTIDEGWAHQRDRLGDRALSPGGVLGLVARLRSAALIERPDAAAVGNADEVQLRQAFRAVAALRASAAKAAAVHDALEGEREAATGRPRVKVVGVQVAGNVPPLSTGMVLSHAAAFDGGRLAETYDLFPRWITEAAEAPSDDSPVVYLFTDYLWSHEVNLELSAALKARNPRAITVHGGPDCPSYPGDTEAYLLANPQVDIAVRGEGEVTASEVLGALASSIWNPEGPDLAELREVPGIAFQIDGTVVRTDDRPRMEDVNVVPSPYLTGVFDAFGDTHQMGMAIIETNRGCPYGCTFCDWGSATNSRIRQFDLQRVLDELEWCAQHSVPRIFMADANFGIFSRDVEIARHVADLRARYGFPKRFITNYAKNTVKHLREIVAVLSAGGVLSEGLLSLQTMDADTLAAIRRSNIKLEKYEALATEFHQANMPLFVDLMIGLPGQTVESLASDLQQCVDREVNAKCHATELLVNSPMNDPAYRSEYQVATNRPPGVTGRGVAEAAKAGPALVVSSSSYTRDDFRQMDHMRRTYLLTENLGALRHVSRFVRRELGLGEVALIETIRHDTLATPERWPALAMVANVVPDAMVPPVSWAWFVADLRDYCIEVLGLALGSDLDTVLAVQHALLPAPGRTFPIHLELEHDYAAWYLAVLEAKDRGHAHDWEHVVDRLASFGPATFTVDDPNQLCRRVLGHGSAVHAYLDWELASPVARSVPAHYQQ